MSTTEEVAHAPRGTQDDRVTVHGRREYATNPVWAVRDSLNPNLTMGHKAVLFALASRIGIDGTDARPSLERLATDAGGSRGHVKLLVDELVAWGIVQRKHVVTRTGRHCEYAIDLVALRGSDPLPVSEQRAAKNVHAKALRAARGSSDVHDSHRSVQPPGVVTASDYGSSPHPTTHSHRFGPEVSIGKEQSEAASEECTLTRAGARATDPNPSKPRLAKTKAIAAKAATTGASYQRVDEAGAAEIKAACQRNPRHPVAQTVRLKYSGDYARCSVEQLDFVRSVPKKEAKYHDAIARVGIDNVPAIRAPKAGETIIVGSHHTCDVVVDAVGVGRHHLQVVGTGHGYQVTVLEHEYATYFSGEPIQPEADFHVSNGAPLVMGDYAIRIGHPTAAMAAA